ncbi:MAG TPA: sulfatase-like hydrolase/transferase, partial [Thermoanaerobaculia bacterium]|nr:sulfatase-like hydrolase/transferase [Thermoanaerobaculia bacterium]
MSAVIHDPSVPRPTFRPAVSTRAFFDGALVLFLVSMFVLRLHIHGHSPLPSQQALPWLAAGIAEDSAIAGLAALLLLALARLGRRDGWTRVAFATFVTLLLGVALVWSEVVIFFGQVPPREVLPAGMNFTFARGSASGAAVRRAALLLLPAAFLLWTCARQARKARWAWASAGRLFAASLIAGIVAILLPASIHRRETARNPLVAQFAIWGSRTESGARGGSPVPAPRSGAATVRRLAPENPSREYLSEGFPLSHRAPRRSALAPRLPSGLRPNIVFLLLEGVRAEEVGVYGGKPAGLTPNLDRLARDGVLVEKAFSPGQQTPDAELALWYGIHPNPYSSVMMSHPTIRLWGLPEILRESGWRSFLWIHNGDQHFYRRDGFYLPRGFQMVDGSDFPADDPRTNWGYTDRALA